MSEIITCLMLEQSDQIQQMLNSLQISVKVLDVAPKTGLYLLATGDQLSLVDASQSIAKKPLVIDFVGGAIGHRRKQGIGKKEPLAKAFGLHKTSEPKTIIDATAGLGRDSFLLANCGCTVLMYEREAEIAALLADGVRRGVMSPETSELCGRMKLTYGVFDFNSDMTGVDGIYLDPMFPERSKSALVKKDMQLFHQIAPVDLDEEALMGAALSAKKRVVVKRPITAGYYAENEPTYSLKTKLLRYDVYIESD